MPIDNWFLLALIMIFSSIIFCGILPIIIRLLIARRRYRRSRLDLQAISRAPADLFQRRTSIEIDPNLSDFLQTNVRQSNVVYSQIPFIDDETSV